MRTRELEASDVKSRRLWRPGIANQNPPLHDARKAVRRSDVDVDDSEGPRASLVRAFGARVATRCGRQVRFHDERLSSAAADWSMARSGMTRGEKKQRRDALAAAAILAGFLETLARTG